MYIVITFIIITFACACISIATGAYLYSRRQYKYVYKYAFILFYILGSLLLLLGIWIARESRGLPRELALQASRSRLYVIGGAFKAYQQEYGAYPDRMNVLVDKKYVTPRTLLSPFIPNSQVGKSDYLYCVTKYGANAPSWWPLLVDKADTHADGARSVLFHSGETVALSKEEWDRLIVRYTDDCIRLTKTRPEFRAE
jgi:hypothetical protein